jgi:hypothetical protein
MRVLSVANFAAEKFSLGRVDIIFEAGQAV